TDLGDISFNSITGLGDKAIRYDPALYDNVVWDEEAVTRYYGKNLTPAYIPAGLRASPKNQTATVVTDKGGNIKDDTIQLGFYHDYYPDGSEKLTEDVAACKGFSMRVSKIGLRQDCYYMMPENEVKISDIGGINVIFGHRAMPYGPYDAETHAPAGYYDMYIAEFEQAGIAYELISDQLETEELVKIVSSIIYGKEVIVDE
ncbi:MAG: hypothetical protein Q4G07_04675, partial [Oscillospiraceae bacterium]|nr:hypothetical protein [Oscillospiraceae bacterium]